MIRALVLVGCLLASAMDFPPYQDRHPGQVCPGATSFYRAGTPRPVYARRMRVACVIGNHIFLAPAHGP